MLIPVLLLFSFYDALSKAIAREDGRLFPKEDIRSAVTGYCERQAVIERNPEIRGTMINEVYENVEEFLNLSDEVKDQALLTHCQDQRRSGVYATTEFMQGNIYLDM